jgi:hypothetical protein
MREHESYANLEVRIGTEAAEADPSGRGVWLQKGFKKASKRLCILPKHTGLQQMGDFGLADQVWTVSLALKPGSVISLSIYCSIK